ncbi:MAG TPA: GSU2403 family nucleotidyltransferase fold protein [Alphaproteobacteria bacterium]|nr:GSU2403 family nucleotidyltransferase fold protein [Alphaproteobacteria bacterium]
MAFPLSVQTTYQDLVEMHRLQALSEIPGTPFLKELPQGKYWYARRRIGDRTVDRYIGPDSGALRDKLQQAKGSQEARREFERRAARLVAQLRGAGLPGLDRTTGKVLNAMARVGVFRLGGTLVGTHAFRLYAAELGDPLSGVIATTEDVDIAAFENLKLVIEDTVDPSIADTFRDLQLEPAPDLDPKHRPTRWVMRGGGAIVDFLVPRMREGKTVVRLEPLGVYAQALPFLNFLIADPIPAVALYRSGVLVQIPRPERYAIHKLIVAQRRSGPARAKAAKDLAQAQALIAILVEDRPQALEEAYRTALAKGPKWRDAIRRSLKQRAEISRAISSLL